MTELNPLILETITKVNKSNKFPLDPILEYKTRKYITTGSIAFDRILGGGYPEEFIIQLAGYSQMGKTTLALYAISLLLKRDPKAWVVYYDSEYILSKNEETIDNFGIDKSRFVLIEPLVVEEITKSLEGLLESDNPPTMVVVDSVGQVMSMQQREAAVDTTNVGGASKKWTDFVKRLTSTLKDTHTTLLLLNHLKDKLAVMSWQEKTYRPGGDGIEFACYIIVDFESKIQLKDKKDNLIGWEFRPKTYKHKGLAPRQTAKVNFIYRALDEEGNLIPVYEVDNIPPIVEIGKDMGLFTKADGEPITGGGRWHYKGEFLASKQEEVIEVLRDREDLVLALEADIYARM